MLAFAPLDAAVGVAAPVVAAIAAAVTPIAGSAAMAVAVVLFTLAVRLLVLPLSYQRSRSQRRRARLAPQVAELHRRHRGDPARLAAELSALGAHPLAGCLPTLLQMPFFLLLYRLFSAGTIDGRPSGILAGRLFGVPLGHHLTDGVAGAVLPVYAVLLVLATLVAWWTSRRMRAVAAATAATPDATPGGEAAAVVARLLPVLPYLALTAVPVVPLAVVLYLITTTVVSTLEQVVWGPPVNGAPAPGRRGPRRARRAGGDGGVPS